MGESEVTVKAVAGAYQEAIKVVTTKTDKAMRVHAPGGIFTVGWDERGSAP